MDTRLKRSTDFDRVFKKGKRCFSKNLMMVFVPSGELKIGFSVGKKHGNAVTRNRIKRLLCAATRENIGLVKGNYHVVILPKVSENYSFKVFSAEMESLFGRNLTGERDQ